MDTLGMSVMLGHLEKKEARSVMNPNKDIFLYFISLAAKNVCLWPNELFMSCAFG